MINLKSKNWTLNNIDTVLFDKDGTFIDLHFFWGKMTEMRANAVIEYYKLGDIFFELCLDLGYNISTKRMLSDGITALYSRSKIIDIFIEKLKKYGVFATKKELENIFDKVSEEFYKNLSEYTKPIKSAIEFIKNLYSKGAKLGIVTSDSIKSTKLTLREFDLEYLFGAIAGRESSVDSKESGALTKLLLTELKSEPRTTIMIGDAPMDYISAKNADINRTILVSTGQINISELQKITPYCVNSLDEIEIFY